MKILLIANFVSFPWEKGNCRFMYLINCLDCKKNDIEIITSDYCHNEKKIRNKKESNFDFKITYIHEPGYKKNVSFKRFFSHFVWGMNIKKYLKEINKPDVIYCSVPSLTGPFNVAKYCKKNNIRFIIDIQDLWPEAFKMVFNPPIINKLIYSPFNIIANSIYKKANDICAVSDTYLTRAESVNKNKHSKHTVYLGTDLKQFDLYSKKDEIVAIRNKDYIQNKLIVINEASFLLSKPNNEIWISYCGTIGNSYDLESIIKALAKLNNDNNRLIVMGDGPLYEKMINLAKSSNIKATFTGRIRYDKMCNILCNCDIAVNPIMHKAAQSIINKHADYLAAGLPIVSTQENAEFCKIIDTYKIGYNCENGNIDDIANCINELSNKKDLRNIMGKNARALAEEKFDRSRTYKDLVNVIMQNNKGKTNEGI